ncbi:hypothetical protein NUW54_g10180 [Trametes sanguinea]|uniref:Uncharacterized protein n=1 Tax=Trametes sanguinea TaxID=158606 RepID=A0ACC1P1E9_9APHY|nr:hypothetical protein NUW54_g10180 [Trametes sanguinea]
MMPFTMKDGVPFSSLRCNQPSLISLRSSLGQGDLYLEHQKRFGAADVAFLVAGAHSNGNHAIPPNGFHPAWYEARETSGSDPTSRSAQRAKMKTQLKSLLHDPIEELQLAGCILPEGPSVPGCILCRQKSAQKIAQGRS